MRYVHCRDVTPSHREQLCSIQTDMWRRSRGTVPALAVGLHKLLTSKEAEIFRKLRVRVRIGLTCCMPLKSGFIESCSGPPTGRNVLVSLLAQMLCGTSYFAASRASRPVM